MRNGIPKREDVKMQKKKKMLVRKRSYLAIWRTSRCTTTAWRQAVQRKDGPRMRVNIRYQEKLGKRRTKVLFHRSCRSR